MVLAIILTGKMMVLLFSAEMLFRVWRYLSYNILKLLSSPAWNWSCPPPHPPLPHT